MSSLGKINSNNVYDSHSVEVPKKNNAGHAFLPQSAIFLIHSFRDNFDPSLSRVCKDWQAKIKTYEVLYPLPDKVFSVPDKVCSVAEDQGGEGSKGIHVNMSYKPETAPAEHYSALINKKTSSEKLLSTDGLGGCVAVITYHEKSVSLAHLTHGVNWDIYKSWLSRNDLLSKDTVVALVGGVSSFRGSLDMVSKLESFFAKNKMRIVVKDLYGEYSRSLSLCTSGELTIQRWKFVGLFTMKKVLEPRWSLNLRTSA